VARAHHPAGPYQTLGDATGTEGTILVENERWLAPGHNSIITDASGQDWLLGHAIDRQQPTFDAINDEQGYARRPMILCRVDYTADGWPTVSW
jgi:arabinan endo-1,5-alpha-L-arabinosidase